MFPEDFSNSVAIFMQRIIDHAYIGARKVILDLLEKGPPGRRKPTDQVDLHQWYIALSAADKANLARVVEATARVATFGFLVVLDNKTIGYPWPEQISDFAVYIQKYSDQEARNRNEFAESVRVNKSYEPDGDLHERLDPMIAQQVAEL